MPQKGERTPKVPLVFRVGVAGHRSLPSGPELRATVRHALWQIQAAVQHVAAAHPKLWADPAKPRLRLVGSLAEGADQLVTEVALELGFELCCPLPFGRNDLQPAERLALEGFEAAHPERTFVEFELDGDTRLDRAHAYAAAADIMLHQVELVVAVWDGKKARGVGGTAETVQRALERGTRVLWIQSDAPHLARVLTGKLISPTTEDGSYVPGSSAELDELASTVADALGIPSTSRALEEWQAGLVRYYGERWPSYRLAQFWTAFRGLLGTELSALRAFSFRVPRFEKVLAEEWSTAAPPPLASVNRELGEHYCWADALAGLNAEAYRSSFVVLYGLSATAALLALLPLVLPREGAFALLLRHGCLVAEFVVLSSIVWVLLRGKKQDWHRRWLDYRIVAELIRQLKLQIPLGGARRFAHHLAHASIGSGSADRSWMYFHVRALDRAVGLPDSRAASEYPTVVLRELEKHLRRQIEFHENNHRRAERLERRLHYLGLGLFVLSAGLVVTELVELLIEWLGEAATAAEHAAGPEHDRYWMILCAAFFPALGAAFAAIKDQGEFGRMARRSEDMTRRLSRVLEDVNDRLNAERVTSDQAADLVERASEHLVEEVLAWRSLLIDRPLTLPS